MSRGKSVNPLSIERPPLTRTISVQDFRDFYWLKEELQQFCRECGINTGGGKIEIADRIEQFLRTGKIIQHRKTSCRSSSGSSSPLNLSTLSLDTVIVEGFKCTQVHREFFKSVIGPKFHFSTFIQNFIKANVGKTYRDVVEAWHDEQARKKDVNYKTEIAPQFEYNRFTRDFFKDPKNQGKTRNDAIDAWKIKRSRPGDNKYDANED